MDINLIKKIEENEELQKIFSKEIIAKLILVLSDDELSDAVKLQKLKNIIEELVWK